MGAPKTPASIDVLLDWFEHALTDCADFLERKPHAFLWSARRCAEALCVVLAVRADQRHDKLDEQSLETLAKHVPPKHFGSIKSLQMAGNYGAHVQPTERFDLRLLHTKADEVRNSLIVLTEWFYTEALGRSIPDRVARDLERIRSAGRATVSSPPLAPGAAPRPSRGPWATGLLLLLGLLGGASGTLLCTGGRTTPLAAPTTRTPPRPPAPDVARAPVPPTVVVADAAVPPPRTPSPGTLPVEGGDVVIGQPDRPAITWGTPSHPQQPRQSSVADFAIDERPITVRDYESCVRAGRCAPVETARCTTQRATADAPVACVSWTQAQVYCARRNGALPTVAQWERVAEQRLHEQLATVVEFEWVDDLSPSPAFDRGPPRPCPDEVGVRHPRCHHTRRNLLSPANRPRYSWNISHEDRRVHDLGFRCAYPR